MKSKLTPSIVLGSICLVVALLLSVVNMFTAPVIAKNQSDKANAAFAEILPGAAGKQDLTITDAYPDAVDAGYKFSNGYVFQMTVAGYKPGLVILCGIDNEGKITGMKHIQSGETFGFENELNGAYTGETLESAELVIATGATSKSLTSKAYFEAVKAALQAFVVANGGEVDYRSPEDIKCNEALGTETLEFAKWFTLAKLEGIDTVYVAKDNSARVYVIGESYVGVKDGAVVTANVSADDQTAVLEADTLISSLTLEDAVKPEGAAQSVKSVKRASNGTYVFELEAKGYQAMFDWGDGTVISIKVSIGADGKILDVVTVSHAESAGYGDECATEEYYSQYRGKGDADVKISASYPNGHESDLIPEGSVDVGVITSATYTTVGYQTAIKDAFYAFSLLTPESPEEGGNQ